MTRNATSDAETVDGKSGVGIHRGARIPIRALREYGMVGAFVLLFVTLSVASPPFLSKTNMLNLLDQNAPIGIIACGGTLVIIAGGFDLSVGAIFACCGVIAAKVTNSFDPFIGIMAGIAVGLLFGIGNGLIIRFVRINTFIGTLATGYVIRGIGIIITSGFLISVSAAGFATIGQDDLFGVAIAIWLLGGVAVITGFILARTGFGRYIYAVGGNAEAARLSGVRTDYIRTATFAISGLCAGLAGVLAASQDATGQAEAGIGFELTAIAAIVVGGTSIAGGEGAIWRTILGVFLIALINNGFDLLNINPFYQPVVQGLIILVAVGLDVFTRRVGSGA